MQPLIELNRVRFAFGDRPLYDDLSLTVPRGKVTVIMGPSGCGKSTLLNFIGGRLRPDAGEVMVDGVDVPRLNRQGLYKLRKRMGMLFQNSALLTDLNVFENVAFPVREHTDLSRTEVRDRVMDRLSALGIAGAAQKLPAQLSGGMQKRVAVARAMILESEILIYDEPTTGLDPITTETVDELIVEAEEMFGVTSIVISHDMASVVRIADHLSFLHQGEIAATGTPQELLHTEHPATAEFIRASRITLDS